MRGIFSWKNYAKIFKMGIDKFAQIMYNRYNGGIWDIDKKIMSERTEKEKDAGNGRRPCVYRYTDY